MKRLDLIEKYIVLNNKIPSLKDKNKETRQLRAWLTYQQHKYKSKTNIMANIEIYNKMTQFMEKYKEYFISNKNKKIWLNNLELVKKYIDINKKRPSYANKKKEIKQLGSWIIHQINIYKSKKEIMSNLTIYNEWTQFVDNYKEYFIEVHMNYFI